MHVGFIKHPVIVVRNAQVQDEYGDITNDKIIINRTMIDYRPTKGYVDYNTSVDNPSVSFDVVLRAQDIKSGDELHLKTAILKVREIDMLKKDHGFIYLTAILCEGDNIWLQ